MKKETTWVHLLPGRSDGGGGIWARGIYLGHRTADRCVTCPTIYKRCGGCGGWGKISQQQIHYTPPPFGHMAYSTLF